MRQARALCLRLLPPENQVPSLCAGKEQVSEVRKGSLVNDNVLIQLCKTLASMSAHLNGAGVCPFDFSTEFNNLAQCALENMRTKPTHPLDELMGEETGGRESDDQRIAWENILDKCNDLGMDDVISNIGMSAIDRVLFFIENRARLAKRYENIEGSAWGRIYDLCQEIGLSDFPYKDDNESTVERVERFIRYLHLPVTHEMEPLPAVETLKQMRDWCNEQIQHYESCRGPWKMMVKHLNEEIDKCEGDNEDKG